MRLSIALCTYNGEKFLAEQLESFRSQSRLPDELVVCDDRSADGTIKIVEDFAKTVPFPVAIHRNEINLGSTKNFERAISLCRGDIIALSDQDDVWLPPKLQRIEEEFAKNPSVGLVFSDAFLVSDDLVVSGDRLWSHLRFTESIQRRFEAGQGPRLMLPSNLVTGATCAFRATLRDALLPIPPSWVHDGWIAFLAAALTNSRVIPEPLILYRQHSNQQIGILRLSLRRQWESALKMDAAYFQRTAECFGVLADRLQHLELQLRDPHIISLTRLKAKHAMTQMLMRQTNRIARSYLAIRELGLGRYHHYGRGLKSFAVDLLV